MISPVSDTLPATHSLASAEPSGTVTSTVVLEDAVHVSVKSWQTTAKPRSLGSPAPERQWLLWRGRPLRPLQTAASSLQQQQQWPLGSQELSQPLPVPSRVTCSSALPLAVGLPLSLPFPHGQALPGPITIPQQPGRSPESAILQQACSPI